MTAPRRRIIARIAAASSLAIYIASLGMPALEFAAHPPVRGIEALCWGWWGILTGDFPWFANPLYFTALLLAWFGKESLGRIFCGVSLALGMLSLLVRAWWFNEGSSTPVERLGSAFYFWMASFLVLFLMLFFVRAETKDPAPVSAP